MLAVILRMKYSTLAPSASSSSSEYTGPTSYSWRLRTVEYPSQFPYEISYLLHQS